MRKPTGHFAYAKTKAQISFAVTAKLISAFVFATWIAQFPFFLNPNFPASSNLLCLYNLVCVGPVQNHIVGFLMTRLPYLFCHDLSIMLAIQYNTPIDFRFHILVFKCFPTYSRDVVT